MTDQPDVYDAADWAKIVNALTRCEHGRVQGDPCFGCPDGWSPDRSGTVLGHGLDGAYAVVIPPRGESHRPEAWWRATRNTEGRTG